MRRAVERIDGYAPIEDYAVIGDGRTVALVACDGSIDWWCLPSIDSPSVFGKLLDARRGGCFELEPEIPFVVERRYVPRTNVLETTFYTDRGVAKLTDAMTLPGSGIAPFRELVRRIEGLSGRIPFRWRVEPRFGYGTWATRITSRLGVPVALSRTEALAVRSWDCGEPERGSDAIAGRFEMGEGGRSLFALGASHQEPLVFPVRASVEARVDEAIGFWRKWTEGCYQGPWEEAVCRSALALKLLVYSPSGAVAAAGTTSLPEEIGGERNWDYRYCWIRDAAFTLDAMVSLGFSTEAHSFFWWFMHSTQLNHPRLCVLYRMDGGSKVPEREIGFEGYRGSRPVRVGNQAAEQLQLDIYGSLLETVSIYVARGGVIDRETGKRLCEVADFVCRVWREPDSGIWEVRSAPSQFTQSKLMCWVALDRAIRLSEDERCIPSKHVERWKAEAKAIREFIEAQCWSEELSSYVRCPGSRDLDASLLLMARVRYHGPREPRLTGTIRTVRDRLGSGPLVRRYSGEDGVTGSEGCFLTCSFWLVEALALCGETDEAGRLMDELVGMANDVGLYAEEMDGASGKMLGNFPQALTHLALIQAALAFKRDGE